MVSNKRLLEMIAEEIQNGDISSLDRHGVHAGRVKMARLYELIEKGDEAARGAYRRLSRYLGIGLSNLIKIYDPQALIISGDIFRRSKFAADLTKQDVRSHFPRADLPRDCVDGSPTYHFWKRNDCFGSLRVSPRCMFRYRRRVDRFTTSIEMHESCESSTIHVLRGQAACINGQMVLSVSQRGWRLAISLRKAVFGKTHTKEEHHEET